MLTDAELEQLFSSWHTPEEGRVLIREVRRGDPTRNLQHRNDTVRTRFISKKMGRALYAESRTCEFPALYMREFDPKTIEMWPQPVKLDLVVDGPNGGKTRLAHTPDLLLITNDGLVMEEWREEQRLQRLAADRPHHFYKDGQGRWHFRPAEQYLDGLGIEYRLRSADEHPRVYLSNLSFLEEYSADAAPPVPDSVQAEVKALLQKNKYVPHLHLVHEHKVKADHIFQMVLQGSIYVDLYKTLLRKSDELILYCSEAVGQADALLRETRPKAFVQNTLALAPGRRFTYDNVEHEVVLVGRTEVVTRGPNGEGASVPLSVVQPLFDQGLIVSNEDSAQRSVNVKTVLCAKGLERAMTRLKVLSAPGEPVVSKRTLRRWRSRLGGLTTHAERIEALLDDNPGNSFPRLPEAAIMLAKQSIAQFYNKPNKPSISSAYSDYVNACSDSSVRPMSRSAFYLHARTSEDVAKREGKRMAYQKAPIPLTYDYEHPVHGVLPHEVCYCDHTTVNVFLKGSTLPDLGKPTLSLMVDGALSKVRAFYLSYQNASSVSVMMCLRDYVRRHGRLPRTLVLDNGREFHSEALKLFCSVFCVAIRWRRRSQPRDSAIVERMLGATETEVIGQLYGNSIALKDPRMVSSSHQPQKHIAWTLPALHGALQHYLFEVHPNRVHPRFGLSPNDFEKRLVLEHGAREHIFVRYDEVFRMLTAPHPATPHRMIDRRRGVYVDGMYYWNDKFAQANPRESVEVRVELWHASVVYVNFGNEWLVAQARDGRSLQGRFRPEVELQLREENRRKNSAAQNDRASEKNSQLRLQLWEPQRWDERLREQLTEMYYLYEKLGMTEVLPEAINPSADQISLPPPKSATPASALDSPLEDEWVSTAGEGTRGRGRSRPQPRATARAARPTRESQATAGPDMAQGTLDIKNQPKNEDSGDVSYF